jgi:hypothetical protein
MMAKASDLAQHGFKLAKALGQTSVSHAGEILESLEELVKSDTANLPGHMFLKVLLFLGTEKSKFKDFESYVDFMKKDSSLSKARIKRAPIGGHLSFRSAADFWGLDLLNSEGDCTFACSAPLVCQCTRCSWHGQLDTQLSRQCSPLVSALKRFPHCWRFGSRKPIA